MTIQENRIKIDVDLTAESVFDYDEIVLQYHDDANNSHKYYAVYPRAVDTLCAYGRVGKKPTMITIDRSETYKKVRDKMNNGYDLVAVTRPGEMKRALKDFIAANGGEEEFELPD